MRLAKSTGYMLAQALTDIIRTANGAEEITAKFVVNAKSYSVTVKYKDGLLQIQAQPAA